MAFWQSLFASGTYVGVDIGTTSIKLAEVTHLGNSVFRLKNYGLLESYGHLERLNDAIQTSSLKLYEKETIALLKILLGRVRPSTKRVIASLPPFSSVVTLLEMPVMSDNETAKAMPFQVRQFIPIPVSEVAIDWVKVGIKEDEHGNAKQQILLISVPNEHIQKYRQIFSAVGLRLVALEVEGLALARILINGDPTPTLIVDIGSRSTNVMIADGGYLKLSPQTDFAGGTLTQAISSGLNIDVRRAEELKKLRGLKGSGGEYELSTLMLPYLDAIIGEAKRLKTRYETEYKGSVERIILTGGTAALLGIDKYFADQVGLPTVKANPFARIEFPQHLQLVIDELAPAFSVALGLSMRGFI
jgi:type IV pilus assembly protein PilM